MQIQKFFGLTMLLGVFLVTGTVLAGGQEDTSVLLNKAVNGTWRTKASVARDKYRHPVKTLKFFGLEPDMTVIELAPGGGWYTDILAPFLHDHGQLYETVLPPDKGRNLVDGLGHTLRSKLKAHPAIYGHIDLVSFAPPRIVKLGTDNSADMVLTFRNTHDWLNRSPATLAAVFKAAYDVLKPGGIFGVVEHRARPNENAIGSAKRLHRIPEDYLINLGLKTGFRLVATTEINANPKDDETVNVHRLPPDLAGPASEHSRMRAIGESDRMTLKFVKPH